MRTDRRPEEADGTDEADGSAPLSRRTFLLAGGAAVGTVVGAASKRAEGAGQHLRVAATGPYRSTVRSVAETDGGAAVDVRPASEFGDATDVLVSGRPTGSDGAVRGVTVDGRAALAHPDGEWRECLRRPEIRERWASDVPVETWREVDRTSGSEADRKAGGKGDRGSESRADRESESETDRKPDHDPSGVAAAARRSTAGSSVLVRGTRAYQYAQGHGGVGYYGVDRGAIEAVPGDASGEYTPVVRLGYVHVDREARPAERVTAFLERYGSHAGVIETPTETQEGQPDFAVGESLAQFADRAASVR